MWTVWKEAGAGESRLAVPGGVDGGIGGVEQVEAALDEVGERLKHAVESVAVVEVCGRGGAPEVYGKRTGATQRPQRAALWPQLSLI